MKPSTSFAGETAWVARISSIWAGSGVWTSTASIDSSAFSSAITASRSASVVSAGRRRSTGRMPASSAAVCLSRMYTSEAGSSPTRTVARPIVADRAHLVCHASARTRFARALPSIGVAAIGERTYTFRGMRPPEEDAE